jgi:hypothetical protein
MNVINKVKPVCKGQLFRVFLEWPVRDLSGGCDVARRGFLLSPGSDADIGALRLGAAGEDSGCS